MITKRLFRLERKPLQFQASVESLEILSDWIDRVLAYRQETTEPKLREKEINARNLLRQLRKHDSTQVTAEEINEFTALLMDMANSHEPKPQPPGTQADRTGFRYKLTANTLATTLRNQVNWGRGTTLALMD